MLSNPKWLGLLAVAFVAGSFVASPELRAFAANTVGSTDIINESILSEDIKNNQVKAADIATDAVGASELQGVTKLQFAKCDLTDGEAGTVVSAGFGVGVGCSISGVTADDQVMATPNYINSCFAATGVVPQTGTVSVALMNTCNSSQEVGSVKSFISLIVYRK